MIEALSTRLTPAERTALDESRQADCSARFAKIPAETVRRFDSAIEQDEASRLRSAYDKRLAAALATGDDDPSLAAWRKMGAENYALIRSYDFDQGLVESAEVGLEISAEDRRFAFSAEGEFLAICKERTGESLHDEALEEMRKADAHLLSLSHQIAAKMGAAGFDAYRQTPFGTFRYFVHSRHTVKLPGFRRCTFIPVVAKSLRAPMLSALESFLERHDYCRMWTFTSGRRVPLRNIRARAQWMHGKLSDLNASKFMREAGVEIVFRSTELGTPEFNADGTSKNGGEVETDENGQMYFHVHAHCVVHLKFGHISKRKWTALLGDVGHFWGRWWKDGGEDKNGNATSGLIVDPREVCKYVTKPAEMLKLSGEQLVELQKQLCRLKLVQPMGTLAAEMKRRRDPENPLRLVRRRTPEGNVYREAKNWNRHCRRTRLEKTQDQHEKLSREAKVAGDTIRVVARNLPAYGPSGVSEPTVVVLATRWDEAAVRKDPRVAALIAATADEFAAGSAIRVHTCTPSVLETSPFPFVATLPPPRIPLTGAEIAGFTR